MKTKNLRTLAIAGTLLLGVTSAASNFMHYETVDGIGTITICDVNDSSKCITMQDKNLGATKSGTTCSSTDTGACGNHYQRGNNYGFANPGVNGEDAITSSAIEETISTEGYGPGNYFSGSIFRKITSSPYDWSSPKNDNLRGGANDSRQANNRGFNTGTNAVIDAENRRGPCDAGYHVPSAGERGTLLQYWAGNYTGAGNSLTLQGTAPLNYFSSNSTAAGQFKNDFMIPFAGCRILSAKVYNLGDLANLWSSSLNAGNERARYFYLDPNGAIANYNDYRAYAFSVRCFKDSALGSSSSEGGNNTGQVTLTITAGENTCTLDDYNLGTHDVSAEGQHVSTSGQDIACQFLQNSGVIVTVSMHNLSDGTNTIGNQYFTGIVTNLGPSLGSIANLTGGSYGLSGTQPIYTKAENTIGSWTGSLALEGLIPAGTPGGNYTGAIEIIIQPAI